MMMQSAAHTYSGHHPPPPLDSLLPLPSSLSPDPPAVNTGCRLQEGLNQRGLLHLAADWSAVLRCRKSGLTFLKADGWWAQGLVNPIYNLQAWKYPSLPRKAAAALSHSQVHVVHTLTHTPFQFHTVEFRSV